MLFTSIIFSALLLLSPAKQNCQTETYTLSGLVASSYKQSGGVEHPSEPEPFPMRNTRFAVVNWRGDDQLPVVYKYFKTDDVGLFSIKLPPGKYGILLEGDEPNAGQYTPSGLSDGDFENFHIIAWHASFNGPIEITDQDVFDVYLERMESHICGTCP